MPLRRITGLALTIALLGLCLPATAGAPEVAGLNHLSAVRNSAMTLTLPEKVVIDGDPFHNKLAQIRSTGRIAGLVFKQDVPKDGIEILALSFALCDKTPCKEKRLSFTQVWNPGAEAFPRKVALPAGRYLAYVITDGQPTEVDLRFPQLAGEKDIAIPSTDAVDISVPKPTLDQIPAGNVYSAEAKQSLDAIGWSLIALELKADNAIYGDIETCLQKRRSDPVLSHASVPFVFSMCNGSGAGSSWFGLPTGPNREVIVGLASVNKGRYFNGLAYRTVAQIQEVNTLSMDLSYPGGRRTGGISAGLFHSDDG
jgi:hypothetical protein